MKQPKQTTLYFGLTPQSISILVSIFFILLYITYLFYMPYKAERHFRDGYNQTVVKRYPLAIKELKLAQKYAPWETHYQVQLGRTYEAYAKQQPSPRLKLHYYKKIESLYKGMIRLDPRSPWFNNRLSLIYLSMAPLSPSNSEKYMALALENAKQAAHKANQNPLFQLNYASFLHRKNNLEDAKKYYLKTIELDPRTNEAHFNLAAIYQGEGHLDKALTQYLHLYEHKPDFPQLDLAIASIYIQLNKNENATLYLEKTIKKNPTKESLQTLSTLYTQMKQWNKAVPIYKKYFEQYELSETLHPYYIQALLQTGKKENIITAFQSLQLFTTKFPDNTLAKEQLSRLKPYIQFK